MKSYKDYYWKLSDLEIRLLEEGYWKIGFVDSHNRETPFIDDTLKYRKMIAYFFDQIDYRVEMITPEMIVDFMDNPKTPKKRKYNSTHKIVKRVLKDGTIKEYEYYNTGTKKSD